jgi:hypothetical protein
MLSCAGVAFAMIGSVWPEISQLLFNTFHSILGDLRHLWAHLISAALVILGFTAALVVYVRALRHYRRRSRPDQQRGTVLARSFVPATMCALLGAITTGWMVIACPETVSATACSLPLLTWPISAIYAAGAFFLLRALITSRALVMRPIAASSLLTRWGFLLACFIAFSVVRWLEGHDLPFGLLAVSIGTPFMLVSLDWRQARLYRTTMDQYEQFVRHSIVDWTIVGQAACLCVFVQSAGLQRINTTPHHP